MKMESEIFHFNAFALLLSCKKCSKRILINVFILHRLDLESKIPDTLELGFFHCRAEEKEAALLCLLKHVVEPDRMTIVFAATKHHVEFLHLVRIASVVLNCLRKFLPVNI